VGERARDEAAVDVARALEARERGLEREGVGREPVEQRRLAEDAGVGVLRRVDVRVCVAVSGLSSEHAGVPMKPGKKKPLSSACTTLASLQPCFFAAAPPSLVSLSTKAILPCSSTPIAADVQMSSSVGDML
jgi:hypothetical protein